MSDSMPPHHADPSSIRIVVEIPDALHPQAADKRYVEPMNKLLTEQEAGKIIAVSQGAAQTADEFTRIVTVELRDLEKGLELLGDFLAEQGAPAGTLIRVDGMEDCFFLNE